MKYWLPIILFSVSLRVMAQESVLTGNCFVECKMPRQFKIDTVRMINLPERKKIIIIPPTYLIENSSVADESPSTEKKLPPLYEVSQGRKNSSEQVVKRIKAGGEEKFYLRKSFKTIEAKKMITASGSEQVMLPPTYNVIYLKKLREEVKEEESIAVLCKEELTPALMNNIRERLQARGYETGTESGGMDTLTRQAYEKFKEDNNLPPCGFNISSLQALGVLP